MSLMRDSTGSWWTTAKNVLTRSISPSEPRARAGARSKRKPSTCISLTQYRRLSVTSLSTCGCVASSVLPQPVKSTYRLPSVGSRR
jgi:hypothetical protein